MCNMSAFPMHNSSPQVHQANPQGLWGGDHQNMMLQMGIQYGRTVLQESEQSFLRYTPFISNIRRYFCVDNHYVKRKLGILLYPFFRNFKREERVLGSEHEASGSTTPFGGDASSFSPTSAQGRTSLSPLPVNDVYACDLYLPLMGVITYIILSSFVHGLHNNSVTNDDLLASASSLIFWIVLEVFVLKLASYFLGLGPEANVLDLLALTGYKYITISFIVLLRELLQFESDAGYVGVMAVYVLLVNGFFVMRTLMRVHQREGRTPSNARLMAYGAAFVQAPLVIWMALRPFN